MKNFRFLNCLNIAYELTGDTWVKIVDDPALQGKPVHFVVAGADGQPVLGIETIGLRRIGPDGSLVPWTTPADSILAQAQLYAAATLRDGSIAIGTRSIRNPFTIRPRALRDNPFLNLSLHLLGTLRFRCALARIDVAADNPRDGIEHFAY